MVKDFGPDKNRRVDIFLCSLWCFFIILYFLPLMVLGNSLPHSPIWYFENQLQWMPFWEFASSSLKNGILPVWSPHYYCGFPHNAYPPINIYYPFFYFFHYLGYLRFIYLENIFCYILGGLGFYFALRKYGLGPLASFCGNLSFAGSVYFSSYTSYCYVAPAVFSWYSLGLFAIVAILRGEHRISYFLLLSFCFAISYTHDVEQMFYLFLTLFLFLVVGARVFKLNSVFVIVVAILFSIVLEFLPLVSLLSFSPHSVRSRGLAFSAHINQYAGGLKAFLLHCIFPLPQKFALNHRLYLGISVLYLCLVGLFGLKKRFAFFSLFTICFFILFSANFPPLMRVLYHLPVFSHLGVHYSSEVVIVGTVAFLAGIAMQTLCDDLKRKHIFYLLVISIVLFIFSVIGRDYFRAFGIFVVMTLCGLIYRGFLPKLNYIPPLFLALIFFDVCYPAFRYRPITKIEMFDFEDSVKKYLLEEDFSRYWVLSTYGYEDTRLNPLMGMRFAPLSKATHTPLAYWRVPPRRTAELIDLIAPGFLRFDEKGRLDAVIFDKAISELKLVPDKIPLLSLMGVGRIFSRGIDISPELGFPEEKRGPIKIYRNPFALPRAFVVEEFKLAKSPEEALNFMKEKFDFGKIAVVEDSAFFEGVKKNGARKSSNVFLTLENFTAGKWEFWLKVQNRSDVEDVSQYLLVLTESFVPGWRGEIDGKEVKLIRADYAFIGMPLREGSHKLKLFYKPVHFRLGLWLCLSGWVVFFLFFCLSKLKMFSLRFFKGHLKEDAVEHRFCP